MKRIIILCFCFVLISAYNLFSLDGDWGGKLENVTSLGTADNIYLTQSNKLALWFKLYLNDDIYLSAEGSDLFYFYSDKEIAGQLTSSDIEPSIPNLDELAIIGNIGIGGALKSLSFSLGRFTFKDSSGHILNQALDGFDLSFRFAPLALRLRGGYNGLNFAKSSSMVLSIDDINQLEDSSQWLSSPRLAGAFNLIFPDIAGQELDIYALGQLDMRPFVKSNAEEVVNTIHGGLKLKGGGASFFYDGDFCVNLGTAPFNINGETENVNVLAFLGALKLTLQATDYFRMGAEGFFSSGDSGNNRTSHNIGSAAEDGIKPYSNQFISLSSSSYGKVFLPQAGNLLFAGMNFQLRPFPASPKLPAKGLAIGLQGLAFFRPWIGPVSAAGASESNGRYLGTEVSGDIQWRPLSDLGLSLSGGVFIPANYAGGIFENSRESIESRINLYFNMSF